MQNRNTVLDCLRLFNKSEDHRLYTLAEFHSYCLFPLLYKKARLFYDGAQPIGFVSWAWITEEEATEFLSERWAPDEAVWKRPDIIDDQYQLWGIDFIAPYGHTTKVMRGMMKHSQTVLGQRVPANWRRFKSPDKIHTKEF
jgi:cytolysin-activating lysine-acyltransferase